MAELIKENSYAIPRTAKTVMCLNIGRKAIRLWNRKLVRVKTPSKALGEILDRYESASWSGLIQKPNDNLKTKYQTYAEFVTCENPEEKEKYIQFTMKVLAKDYARFKTLAAFLRISMSLLFFYLLEFDEYNSWPFHQLAHREIVITKTYGFGIWVKFIRKPEEFVLEVNTPLMEKITRIGSEILPPEENLDDMQLEYAV